MESNSNNAPESRLADISEQATPDRRDSQPTTASNTSRIPNRVISMHTGNSVSKLGITSTPRIDISRASSSSQQEDSRDSSPENVFDQVFIIYFKFSSIADKNSLVLLVKSFISWKFVKSNPVLTSNFFFIFFENKGRYGNACRNWYGRRFRLSRRWHKRAPKLHRRATLFGRKG